MSASFVLFVAFGGMMGSNTTKLYHFINEKHGLEAIEKQRLKVAELDKLNDPFEMFPVNVSDEKLREKMRERKDRLVKKFFIICFSKSLCNPLLWSHYADKHKGMVLEFEVSNENIRCVKYRKSRIDINAKGLKNKCVTDEELMITKYIDWEYEEEARLFIPFDEVKCECGVYFFGFNNELALKSIRLGPLSKLEIPDIEDILPKNVRLNVIRSRLAFKTFRVVNNRRYSIKKLEGGVVTK